MSKLPMPCPDCDPHGFDANLETYYGPATMFLSGIRVYSDPRVSSVGSWSETVLDAKSFARGFCLKHGRRTTSAPRAGQNDE